LSRFRHGSGDRTALLAVVSVSAAFALARALWSGGPPVEMSLFSSFSAFGYASIGVHYWLTASVPARRQLVLTAALVSLAGLLVLFVFDAIESVRLLKSVLTSLGVAGVLSYAGDGLRANGEARHHAFGYLRDALIVPIAVMQITYFLWPHTGLNPVFDGYVYDFERVLGSLVEHTVVEFYKRLGVLNYAATICYLALPIGWSVTTLSQPTERLATRVLVASLATGIAGYFLYLYCPVVGPMQSFGTVDTAELAAVRLTAPGPMHAGGRVPRNGMPSLHIAWIALIVFNSGSLVRPWRLAVWGFAALNVLAAMGRYQHWLMDFVVAVPLAAAMQLAIVGRAGSLRWRFSAAAGYAALTVAWLTGFRYGLLGHIPWWAAWIAVALTVALPLTTAWPRDRAGSQTPQRDTTTW
jgi:hypothetical protein